MMQSSSSSDDSSSDLFHPKFQLINTKTVIKNKLKDFLGTMGKFDV